MGLGNHYDNLLLCFTTKSLICMQKLFLRLLSAADIPKSENMSVKSYLTCTKVSLVLIFLQLFQVAQAQYNFGTLDQKLEAAKKELGGSAVALLYKDGKIIYQKALGEQKTIGEFNAKTQAPIGGASQWLTAALVMSFVDEGKLSLDDRVSKFLPAFTKYSKGYITLRHCISHLTGIESDGPRLLGRKKFSSLEEEVDEIMSKKNIESNPGLEFKYSNTGFAIAARVLEVISRRSFDQLMQTRITRPLMMRNTTFSSTLEAPNPTSGALSTANDFINFLSMILNKGMFNGKRILSEKAIADMQAVQTTPPMIKYAPKAGAGYNFGLGEWILQADENGKAIIAAMPGLAGTWPMIDNCRGYAMVVFTRGTLSEEKKEIYLDLKNEIDAVIPSICK